MNKYNNLRATLSIAKASFISIVRSPTAIVFNLLFPLIFIIVFGFIGGGALRVDVGILPTSDTSNAIYTAMKQVKTIRFIKAPKQQLLDDLSKGNIDVVLEIVNENETGKPTVKVQYSDSSPDRGNIFRSVLKDILYPITELQRHNAAANIEESTLKGRKYSTIDFVLPGQLGLSLLTSGVFGTAFVFLSLRVSLVTKRFFATPVKRYSILLGEALSRLLFSLSGGLIIILIGHFFFGFTLIHGVVTVVNMLLLSILGILVFMGIGFIISGVAKNESSVSPISNLITLPQFLLSGTFFSIEAFPSWLQPISKALPLTYLNDALRKIAFEGADLLDVRQQILILLVWGTAIYITAVKVFKWEE